MRFLGCLSLGLVVAVGPSNAAIADAPRAHVMILGVAHRVWKRDVHNSVFSDSPLSPERQTQIADVVRRLSRFHPTKVLVEEDYGDRRIVAAYERYRAGRQTLGANEVYQFGFRLARAAADPSIYPIDTFGPAQRDDPRADAFLKTHFSTIRDARFDAFLARSDQLERNGTYLDLLRYINSDDAIRANASTYSVLDGMGRGADDAGTAYVSAWYTRNCYIFANILSVVRPNDRVVVIMGQGHEYLLRELVRLDPDLHDVDPLQFLS